jgi:hypothetical protein
MPCACGKGRVASARRGRQFVWDYYAPGAEEPMAFGSSLEAKRESRRQGGGEIRRREVNTQGAA